MAEYRNITHDLQNCEVEIVGTEGSFGISKDVEELSYSTTVNREPRYGSARTVQSWTDGEAEHEFSLTISKAGWDYIAAQASERGVSLGTSDLTIGATYFKDGVLTQDTIWKARLRGPSQDYSRGADFLTVTLEFDVSDIFYSGSNIFGQPVGAAT